MTRNIARFLILLRKVQRGAQSLVVFPIWGVAIIIGIAVAYGVIGFRYAIDWVSVLAFGQTEEAVISGAASLSFERAWIAPVIGGFVVAGLLYLFDRFKWLKEGRSEGIADVIEARAVGDARISLRAGLASALVSIVSVGSGGSAGREGPAVHLGGSIASLIDHHLGFSAKNRRMFLGCGAAAAVAASFNAPIAGVLFALEVILGNYALSVFGPITAASVTAAMVARFHLGDFPAFAPPNYGDVNVVDVPLSASLGIICGLIASAFLFSTERLTVLLRNLADKKNVPYYALPPIAGVLIGLIGANFPEVFGVGYEAVTNALAGEYTISMLIILVAMKGLATSITLSSRFGGGVFAPGLVIGAFAGAAFGGILTIVMPGAAGSPILYAMIGMGAAGGAILGAPISTTLIVFEMTGEYGITIALMGAVALATLVTQSLMGRSFFHWQLARKGYDLSEGPHGVILQTIRVREVMERMPGNEIAEDAVCLKRNQSLGQALAILNEHDEAGLPVIDPKNPTIQIGYLSRVKALSTYNKALIDDNIEHHT